MRLADTLKHFAGAAAQTIHDLVMPSEIAGKIHASWKDELGNVAIRQSAAREIEGCPGYYRLYLLTHQENMAAPPAVHGMEAPAHLSRWSELDCTLIETRMYKGAEAAREALNAYDKAHGPKPPEGFPQ